MCPIAGQPSVTDSQESNTTTSTDRVFTPSLSASDGSIAGASGPGHRNTLEHEQDGGGQLHQLSAIAAAQHKMAVNGDGGEMEELGNGLSGGASKRMADGEIKARRGSASPVKGHSRNTSAVSMASTTTSTIGDVSRTHGQFSNATPESNPCLSLAVVVRPEDASVLCYAQGPAWMAVQLPGRG